MPDVAPSPFGPPPPGPPQAAALPPIDLVATPPPEVNGIAPVGRNAYQLTEEQAVIWQTRIDVSKKRREPHLAQWRKFHRWFRGKFKPEEGGQGEGHDDDAIVVNIVYPKIRVLLSELYPDRPRIVPKPRRPMPEDNPVIADGVNKYLEDELGVDEERLRVLQDAMLSDRGWLALGYKAETEIETDPATGGPVVEETGDPMSPFRPRLRLVSEQFWYRHLRYDQAVFDYTANRTKEAKWVAVRYGFTIEEMKTIFGVDPETLPGYVPPVMDLDEQFSRLTEEQKKHFKQYFVWEIWDRSDPNNKALIHLLEGHPGILDSGPWPCEIDDFPIIDFWPNVVTDDAHGVPEMQPIEGQQTEKNRLRTAQMRHIEQETAGFIIDQNKIEERERQKFRQVGRSGFILADGDPGNAVAKPPYNSWPSDRTEMEAKIDRDADVITGISAPQHGVSSQADTATEVRVIERFAELRTGSRRFLWAQFLSRAAKILWQMAQQSIGPNRLVKIMGPRQEQWAIWVPPGEIRADWDFTWEVDLSSIRPRSPQMQREIADKAVELWNGDPLTDQLALRRFWHDSYEVGHPELFRIPDPTQMAAHMMFYGNKTMVGGASDQAPAGNEAQPGFPAGPTPSGGPSPGAPGGSPQLAALLNGGAGRKPLGPPGGQG